MSAGRKLIAALFGALCLVALVAQASAETAAAVGETPALPEAPSESASLRGLQGSGGGGGTPSGPGVLPSFKVDTHVNTSDPFTFFAGMKDFEAP